MIVSNVNTYVVAYSRLRCRKNRRENRRQINRTMTVANVTETYGIDDDVINYLNNAQTLQNPGIKCIRKSHYKIKNNYGNKLLEICCNNNLYICNSRVKGDELGALTCVKGSVIDYLISTIEGILFVNNFVVHNYSPLFSDVHCAISFKITVCQNKTDDKAISFKQKQWEKSKKGHFYK